MDALLVAIRAVTRTICVMAESPSMLNGLIASIKSDRESLFRALIARLDESMICEIARADYGDDEAAHDDALRQIIKTARVESMSWHPGEVLELVRWSRPEVPSWGPGGHGGRGHIMRAFCCAALLHADNYGAGGPNQAVAPLIESVLTLGDELPALAPSFLAWCLRKTDIEREEQPFFALGLIILAAARSEASVEHWIASLIHWIEMEDAAIRSDEFGPVDERTLWGLTHMALSHEIWLRLVEAHLVNSDHAHIRQFGDRLVGEYSRKRRTRRKFVRGD